LQVQRTCEALDQHGFTHITTLELLLRQYEVSTETFHTDAARTAQPNKAGRKRRHDDGGGGSEAAAAATDGSAEGSEQQQQQQQQQPAVLRQVMTRPTMEARGHTGYLTFAHKFVPALALSSGGGDSGDDDEDEDAGDDEQEIEEAGEAAAPGQQ
jgi:tRNA (adenine57-N1/adenine58-N1)-methyltransferase